MSNRALSAAVLTVLLLSLAGCGAKLPPTSVKTFKLQGGQVSFAPPPANWVRKFQRVTSKGADLGMPKGTILTLTFQQPGGNGFLAVSCVDAARDKKGLVIQLDHNQSALNTIARAVISHGGKITSQKYVKVDGENAFRMEFTSGTGALAKHGVQVNFTKGARYYEIALTVPASTFSAALPVFQRVTRTFAVKS